MVWMGIEHDGNDEQMAGSWLKMMMGKCWQMLANGGLMTENDDGQMAMNGGLMTENDDGWMVVNSGLMMENDPMHYMKWWVANGE